MTSTNLVEEWKRIYLMSLSKHGIEQIAAKLANVGLSKVIYFRNISEDFREAERAAKQEYKRTKARGGRSW